MDYISSHIGEFAALAVAFFWTITALAFESASKKIGSIQVNIIRLVIAFIFISVFNFFFEESFSHQMPHLKIGYGCLYRV